MTKHFHQVRHHAKKHEEAAQTLKNMLKRYNPKKEKVAGVFLTTFFIVLFSLLIFRNWGNIIDIFTPEPKQITQLDTEGYKTGAMGILQVDRQATQDYRKRLNSILTNGSMAGIEVNLAFGQERGEQPQARKELLKNSVWLTNYLSRGQHLTILEQKRARALQKSVISTYYLGEKTIDINSILDTDSKILSQISNTLSVDLFQYLNQSVNRSDTLDEYLNLLKILLEKSGQRINDLQSKINFLSVNFQMVEREIQLSEETFFNNLKIFDGSESKDELAKFVGISESQVEIRAKLGAYSSLKQYYEFFRPRLENLIIAIEANRGPLIAGVKVVEIQNMSLPLIIRQR